MGWSSERGSSAGLSGERVLVVDDEAIIALDLESIVTAAGGEVIGPSGSLDTAISLARSDGPTIAVLDVRLGQDNIRPLAELLTRAGVPFLFYSGEFNSEQMRQEWPMCGFVAKPAAPRVLVDALRALLKSPGGAKRPPPGLKPKAQPPLF
jgi:DNA-binding response OmpR family regulator